MGKIYEPIFDIGDIVLNLKDKQKGTIVGIDITDKIDGENRKYEERYYIQPDKSYQFAYTKWVDVSQLKLLNTNPEETLVEKYQPTVNKEIAFLQNLRDNALDQWIMHQITHDIEAMNQDVETMNRYSIEIQRLMDQEDK